MPLGGQEYSIGELRSVSVKEGSFQFNGKGSVFFRNTVVDSKKGDTVEYFEKPRTFL